MEALDVLEVKERAPARLSLEVRVSSSTVRRVLRIALVLQDAVMAYVAVMCAYVARFDLHIGPPIRQSVGLSSYQFLACLLIAVLLPLLLFKGAYRMRMGSGVVQDVARVAGASTTAVATILVISFLLKELDYSRGVVLYLWLFVMVLLALGRIVARLAQAVLHRRGVHVRRLVVVGASDAGKMFMQSIRSRPDLGYEIVGFVDRRDASRVPDFGRFRRLGDVEDLPEIVHAFEIEEVVVALPGSAHEQLRPVIELCESTGIGLKLVPDLFNVSMRRVEVDEVAGIPLLNVGTVRMQHVEHAIKRLIDLSFGLVAFVLSLPVIGVLAILVKLDSEGPAFVRQERIGQDGKPFTCYKLRSMHTDADKMLVELQERNEASGPIFKLRNDPRCTRIGKHLRRLSLDELPQIWNVMRGEMSLVGPRPPLGREVAQYEPWHFRRLRGKPGMTGLWQVSGRSNLTFDEMVMMDIMYLDSWTPLLDLNILFKTATAVLGGRGAY
jgi:exopolysaccharide biosynthesis polyprenyl glycosylphosphotransferase